MRLINAAHIVTPALGSKPHLQRLAVVFLVLCLLWLAGCGEQQPGADAAPEAELALVDEEATNPAPTEAAALVPEPPTADSESVDECLRCHTDKEMLIRTASPEEEVISENEGEG